MKTAPSEDHALAQDEIFHFSGTSDDLHDRLKDLSVKEASIEFHEESPINADRKLAPGIDRLNLLRANVGNFAVLTRAAHSDYLADASLDSKTLSSAVQRLDLEQSRTKETLDVVDRVAELKACVLGAVGAMGASRDWETAAGYLSRASKISSSISSGAFAENVIPTADIPDPPQVTLEHAAESLQVLFLREFEKAAAEGDTGRVTRFFKLFPLIGRPEVGLDAYGRYVCRGVASQARSNLEFKDRRMKAKEDLFYADLFTKLFEHIAQIIEHHGDLVQQYYGSSQMLKVIERLQAEIDVQGGTILDAWMDDRGIDKKLTDIKSYAFTFLVQSFLPTQVQPTNPSRSRSPAPNAVKNNIEGHEESEFDMKDLNNNIHEMSLILSRWASYVLFVTHKATRLTSSDGPLEIPAVISTSALHQKLNNKIVTSFAATTTFSVRRSVERAFEMDEQPQGLSLDPEKSIKIRGPYISTAVDDVMFLVKQMIEKALTTSSRNVVVAVIPSITRILGSDFIGMVQRKMRDECYPKAANQGEVPPEQNTIAFLVLINNLDVAKDYVRRTVDSRQLEPSSHTHETGTSDPTSLNHLFPLGQDALAVSKSLKTFDSTFEHKASELISDGIYVVFRNVMKPCLRPLIAEYFRNVDYQLSSNGVDTSKDNADIDARAWDQGENTVHEIFGRDWDKLIRPLTRLMNPRPFDQLYALVITYFAEILEKRIWSYYGRLDAHGALKLENDVTNIINNVVKGRRYSLRDEFQRCIQICMVVNMEEDEWEHVAEQIISKSIDADETWKLSADELRRARSMTLSRSAV